jgi:putative N6-adenine-specific DNA methylase
MSAHLFVITTPGLEAITAREITDLGLDIQDTEPGGITLDGDATTIARLNIRLRTATRVLVRMGDFHAASFTELERHARRLPWSDYLQPGQDVEFRVTSRKSRLYHQDAIAERLQRVAESPKGGGTPPVQFMARLFRDRCVISVDSSGELLHRRGYRVETAKAPLRETLAAAMILATGWDGSMPLADPFCGSGTIPIEAALIARRIAPGVHRAFAAEQWPLMPAGVFDAVRQEARGAERASSDTMPFILAADRDAGAVAAAMHNAERAGVAGDLAIRQAVISDLALDGEPGWIVTNPPYGVRVGERIRLRNLYARLGDVVRARAPGWEVALLSAHPALDGQTGLPLQPLWEASNGGIRVRLMATCRGN